MSLQIAIIADDLTGALDSAAPFATHGLRVRVAPFVEAATLDAIADCDVFAINTETRALSPEAASREVARAWERLAPFAPKIVFKKIDSRLKGNVDAEVAALMAAGGRTHAVVAPAIPDMGRFVVGGAVVGFGVETAIPVPVSSDVTAPDCADVETLDIIAAKLTADAATHLAVGATGLAHSMAALLGGPARSPARVAQRGPLLIIAGSRDPITLEQLARLEQSALRVFTHTLRLLDLPRPPPGAEIIVIQPSHADTAASPQHVAQALGRVGRALIEQLGIETIVVTGGDTALAFVREGGIRILEPVGAILPGTPIARARIGARTLTLITKSGGFGAPDALVEIARQTMLENA